MLVERADVRKLWTWSSNDSFQADLDSVSEAKRPLRKRIDDDAIRRVAKEVYGDGSNPNIRDAEPLIRKELPGAKRDAIRQVLKEEEFASLRRQPGNQP